MSRKQIINSMVRLKCDIENRGGVKFKKGETLKITGSYRGYALVDPANAQRYITRVNHHDVEFID